MRVAAVLLGCVCARATALDNGAARRPPMGWNSWCVLATTPRLRTSPACALCLAFGMVDPPLPCHSPAGTCHAPVLVSAVLVSGRWCRVGWCWRRQNCLPAHPPLPSAPFAATRRYSDGGTLNQTHLMKVADQMVGLGLATRGYTYLNLDDGCVSRVPRRQLCR